jgi:hypothetical protein
MLYLFDIERTDMRNRRRKPARREQVISILDALEKPRLQVLDQLCRIDHLAQQIDIAFNGQPFLRQFSPTAPANRRRIQAYIDCQTRVSRLLSRTIELYLITCGLKREDDWIPVLIEDMKLKAQQHDEIVKLQQSRPCEPPADRASDAFGPGFASESRSQKPETSKAN